MNVDVLNKVPKCIADIVWYNVHRSSLSDVLSELRSVVTVFPFWNNNGGLANGYLLYSHMDGLRSPRKLYWDITYSIPPSKIPTQILGRYISIINGIMYKASTTWVIPGNLAVHLERIKGWKPSKSRIRFVHDRYNVDPGFYWRRNNSF